MIRTDNEHGLTVRQGLGDGSVGTRKVATVSRTLRTPLTGLGARRTSMRTRRVVSCNYGGFISGGVCVSLRDVYTARVARSGAWGIPKRGEIHEIGQSRSEEKKRNFIE